METVKNNMVHSIYKNIGFMDEYGGSLFITILTCIIFFIAISYFYTMSHVKPIKKNWVQERCNPTVIPFAGLINKEPGSTTMEFTAKNFSTCINNILIEIVQDVLKPIHYAVSAIENLGSDLANDINLVRKKVSDVLSNISSIDEEIMGRILNFLMPVQLMMSKMMTVMKKAQATLVTGFYNVITGYLGLHSFVGAFVDILIIFLVMLASLILPLLFFFFTIPLAIPPLLVFTIVAGFTTLVIVGLSDVLHMTQSSVPPKPRCFDGDTILHDDNNNPIKIKDITIGTKLRSGSIVTSTFVLSSHQMEMYKYRGVVVSGNHYVMHEDVWKTVKEVDDAEPIEDYSEEYIYCINTSSKLIIINGVIFTDWDSLDDIDTIDLRISCKKYLPEDFAFDDIHNHLVGGFDENTSIELDTGQSISIKDVEVNDVLRFGERVLGKVIIDTTNISVKKVNINGKEFICGPNNIIYDNDVGVKTTLDIEADEVIDKPDKLYHLITDNDYIIIDGIQFLDFDGSLEQFLQGPQFVYFIN